MKYLLIVPLLLLAACDNRPLDQREYKIQHLNNIPELRDCVYINLDGLRIIRCPNSTTSTEWIKQQGKNPSTERAMVIN